METDNRYNNAGYLVDRFLNDIVRLALVYVKNTDDAQDVAQQVFVTYLQKLPVFNDESHAKNWLFRVTVNISKNHMRKHRAEISFEELEGVLSTDDAEYLDCTEQDTEVFRAVFSLKRIYREVVHLHYYENYSVAEISKILGIPIPSVRTRLVRARSMLEEILKGGNNAYDEQLQESNGSN